MLGVQPIFKNLNQLMKFDENHEKNVFLVFFFWIPALNRFPINILQNQNY